MSLDGPLEIFGNIGFFIQANSLTDPSLVDHVANLDLPSVRKSLLRIVSLCLDSDPSLIPLSCQSPMSDEGARTGDGGETDDRDPDDFSFWSERQAKRICEAIKQTFDVEYAPEVVVADANVTSLANRILSSKEILTA